MHMRRILVAGLGFGLLSQPVWSQSTDGFAIEGYVGGVTDYRDRGLSLSDRGLAITGSVGAFHENGFYFGLDAGTVDIAGGGDARLEFFTGYSLDAGDYVYDISFELDTFHGGGSQYYPEVKASVSRDFGLAFTRAGVAFAPEGRWFTPGNDSLYTFADVEVPIPNIPALTLITHVGRDFRGDIENLWDWSVGVSAFVSDAELTLAYDTSSFDGRAGSGRVIFGARWYF